MDKKKISLKEIGMPKLIGIFLAGIILIVLTFPDLFTSNNNSKDSTSGNSENKQQNTSTTTEVDTNQYVVQMEKKLETILKKVSGIGNVEVMLTLKSSKEYIPLKDNPYTQESINETDGEGGSRTNSEVGREESTVLVTTEDGKTMPYIIQELEPEVEGILVIAEGGGNVQVISDIVEAAEVLFDVPAHKVKVMEMSDGIKSSGG
ncbi:MAG: hypothetical protein K0S47_3353 [Herbinix sp.]|jgi:stage III sporulation protein AG|nr:hypothetical protein [Herbinix sp.]